MINYTRDEVAKKLSAEGFPFSDYLGSIIAPLIKQYNGEARSGIYTPEVVTFSMVASVLSGNMSLSSAVIRSNTNRLSQGLEPASTNTSSYSVARGRLSPNVLIESTKQIALTTNGLMKPDDFWGEFSPFAIDGSTITANDTESNQAYFPQHGMQADGVGFPILRTVLLQDLRTGMIRSAAYNAFKGKGTGEMALARLIFPDLKKKSLLIGDRYFPSYFTLAELMKRGINGVFPAHAARDLDFRTGKQLGTLDHLVKWNKPLKPSWMSQEEYDSYPESLTVREVNASKELGKGKDFVIVTTLLDKVAFPKSKLAKFYKHRWKIESAFKDLKDTFGMEHIAANSPEMIEKVIWSYLLAYNILRWHMLNAAVLYEKPIDKLSVKTAATVITQNAVLILITAKKDLPLLFANMYLQFVQVPVGMRPGREEPRAVKKRPKPFPRLNEKRSDWHAQRTA